MSDLRDHLFETLQALKDEKMDLDRAKAVGNIAQTIINSAKVEVDYLKTVGPTGSPSQFFPAAAPAAPGIDKWEWKAAGFAERREMSRLRGRTKGSAGHARPSRRNATLRSSLAKARRHGARHQSVSSAKTPVHFCRGGDFRAGVEREAYPDKSCSLKGRECVPGFTSLLARP
jgi:hypothetical protein